MDEKAEGAGSSTSGDRVAHAVISSAEALATRLAALRAEVRAMVHPDEPPASADQPDSTRSESDQVNSLELLLAQAREREDRLTRRAADAESKLAHAEAELQARLTELARLRSRYEDFEREIDALADEVAVAAAGAARADRLKKERDEARARASLERELAAQDRQRADETEERVVHLQSELEAAQSQLANATEFNRRIEAVRESPKVLERVGSGRPWVELQHMASTAVPDTTDEVAAANGSDPVETASTEVVDLTEAEAAAEGATPTSDEVEPSSGETPTSTGGPFRRLWRRRPVADPGSFS
jgi:chromosome segregation ATPase